MIWQCQCELYCFASGVWFGHLSKVYAGSVPKFNSRFVWSRRKVSRSSIGLPRKYYGNSRSFFGGASSSGAGPTFTPMDGCASVMPKTRRCSFSSAICSATLNQSSPYFSLWISSGCAASPRSRRCRRRFPWTHRRSFTGCRAPSRIGKASFP